MGEDTVRRPRDMVPTNLEIAIGNSIMVVRRQTIRDVSTLADQSVG